jgi:hypothetical protein
MRLALTTGFILFLAALITFGPPALDAYYDRQHRVVVDKPLHIYRSTVLPKLDHTNTPLASAAEHDTFSVTRIRYEKDYMVVRVKLADGREGYVFSGDGFHLDPPPKP